MILHGGTNVIDLKGVTLSGTPATIAGLYARVQKAVGTGKTVTIGNFKVSSALIPPAIASVTMDSTSYVITTEKYVITVSSASAVTATAVSSASPYELPTASASVLGGVKVGSGLSIDGSGVLSATGGGGGSFDGVYVIEDTTFTSYMGSYEASVSGIYADLLANPRPVVLVNCSADGSLSNKCGRIYDIVVDTTAGTITGYGFPEITVSEGVATMASIRTITINSNNSVRLSTESFS